MRLTVLGGQGAWPTPSHACSGYLVEHDGFVICIDPGYGTLPLLMRRLAVERLDAVVVSHGHPDHCADLNPMLRARALGREPPPMLPVLAPRGALDRVLALDRMPALDRSFDLVTVADGDQQRLGPFTLDFAELPHHVTNLGMRITGDHGSITYTGDSGPTPSVVELARDTDLLLIEATALGAVTDEDRGKLCDVRSAVQQGRQANAHRVVLTHLWPGVTDRQVIHAAGTGPHEMAAARPACTWEILGSADGYH